MRSVHQGPHATFPGLRKHNLPNSAVSQARKLRAGRGKAICLVSHSGQGAVPMWYTVKIKATQERSVQSSLT